MSDIEDLMRETIERAKAFGMPCLESFALEHGRAFRPVPRPEGVKLGEPKNCFTNSMCTVLEADEDENYRYVEGYLFRPGLNLLIHHAWVTVDGTDEAIDPTLPNPESCEYWGIDFQTEYAVDVMERYHMTGFTLEQFARDLLAEEAS